MSKLYMEYLKKKHVDGNKYYLFKSGMFYIFIDDDAKEISKITPLSITYLNKDIVKCGFPTNSLNKYLDIFNNLGLEIEIVERVSDNLSNVDVEIIKRIRRLNIDNLTPLRALNLLNDFKVMLGEE